MEIHGKNCSCTRDAVDICALVEKGASIVDVRTPEEFGEGHVEKSINIPLQELNARVAEFKALPKPIIVCCKSGGRSEMAKVFLLSQNIQDVYNGGSWKDVDASIE